MKSREKTKGRESGAGGGESHPTESNRADVPSKGPGASLPKDLPVAVKTKLMSRGGIGALIHSLPHERALHERVRILHALADETRLKILLALDRGLLCPCVMKKLIRVRDSNLTYHLRLLEATGLVQATRESTYRVYRLTSSGSRALRLTAQLARLRAFEKTSPRS